MKLKKYFREMEKEFAILLCKAKDYRSLEDFERQFHSYIHLVTSVLNRSGLMAVESSFLQGKKITERRLRTGIKILFSDPGMRDAYLFLGELRISMDTINSTVFLTIWILTIRIFITNSQIRRRKGLKVARKQPKGAVCGCMAGHASGCGHGGRPMSGPMTLLSTVPSMVVSFPPRTGPGFG